MHGSGGPVACLLAMSSLVEVQASADYGYGYSESPRGPHDAASRRNGDYGAWGAASSHGVEEYT